jgi:hypothetical protein
MSDEELEELLQQIREHERETSFPALIIEEEECWTRSSSPGTSFEPG